jgi:hypothetical protein
MIWVPLVAWIALAAVAAAWDRFMCQGFRTLTILPASQQARLVMRLLLQILPSFAEGLFFMVRASGRQSEAVGIIVSLVVESVAVVLALVRIAEASNKLQAVMSIWTVVDLLSFCSTVVSATESCHWVPGTPTEGFTGSFCVETATGVVARTWVSFGFLRLLYARQALVSVEHLLLNGKSRGESTMLLTGTAATSQTAASAAEAAVAAVEEAAARANNEADEEATEGAMQSATGPKKQNRSTGSQSRERGGNEEAALNLGPHRMDPCLPATPVPEHTGRSRSLQARAGRRTSQQRRVDKQRRELTRQHAKTQMRSPAFQQMILAYGSSWHSRMVRMVHGSAWAMADLLLQGSLAVLLLACSFYIFELLGEPSASFWQADSGFWAQYVCSDLSRSNVQTADCSDEGFSPFAAIYFVLVSVTTVSLLPPALFADQNTRADAMRPDHMLDIP